MAFVPEAISTGIHEALRPVSLSHSLTIGYQHALYMMQPWQPPKLVALSLSYCFDFEATLIGIHEAHTLSSYMSSSMQEYSTCT